MSIEKITHKEIQKSKPSIAEVRLKKRTPLFLVLESVRSLYNVGAIFRSSDAALVSKVFLTGDTGSPPRTEIDKSALGATDVVPWEYCRDAKEAVGKLKKDGVSIIALELTRQSIPYYEMRYDFPLCLVIGNEVDGISREVLDLCDLAIDIPMLGRANSLNVSTACAVAMFEILRQYKYAAV